MPSTIKLLAAGAIFCSVIAAFVFVKVQWNKYFDPTPTYLEAIRKSGKFEQPTTIRMNQKPIPFWNVRTGYLSSRTTYGVAKTAKVLEAIGVLTVSKTTSFSTSDLGVAGTLETTSENIEISLTEKGVGESANWRTTEESYMGASDKALWWYVPIGSREITRIEIVNDAMGPNMVDVAIHWRWHPNKLGEGFDCGGSTFRSLPADAQDVARLLGWNSQTEYTARARLRRVGSTWEVLNIDFPNERVFSDFPPPLGGS
jgi:hypothetical protein